MTESTHATKTFGDDSPESKAALKRVRAAYKAAHNRSNPSAVQLPAYNANDPRDAGSEEERRVLHAQRRGLPCSRRNDVKRTRITR